MTIVPGVGPIPAEVLGVGEAPGVVEAKYGRPFVGPSGDAQARYLRRRGVSVSAWYLTNVVQEYKPGNPDPTPEQVAEWTPVLEAEVRAVRPLLVVAIGRFAARWFLGDDATMELCHGLPHQAGCFDPSRADRSGGALVVPVTHPAAGLHDGKGDTSSIIDWDYMRAVEVLRSVRQGVEVRPAVDEHDGTEEYRDVSGAEFAQYVEGAEEVAIDTETDGRGQPWMIQASVEPGTGVALRCERDDFHTGVAALRHLAEAGVPILLHNATFDLSVCRRMGLDLHDPRVRLVDSMYAAYVLRREPQGLKPLAWRWAGMRMSTYRETVGGVAFDQQLEYLGEVLEGYERGWWTKPEPRVGWENDGTAKITTPWPVHRRVESILRDRFSARPGKGDEVNVYRRWHEVGPELRDEVEARLGRMPRGGLDDLPLDAAVHYACRDADATLRVVRAMRPELVRRKVATLLDHGMEIAPLFAEMERTGMPVNRRQLAAFADRLTGECRRIADGISLDYWDGRPFNPNSPPQVAALIRRRGLQATKRTKTGAVSTAKPSIEHLRYEDDAVDRVFEWRERAHTRDMFCTPTLRRLGDREQGVVHCRMQTTRTATRRPATKNPNFLAVSTHSDWGKALKSCYVCPPGKVFGAWDLSAIEMRVMADESRDPIMCRLFREGRDIHTETAARIFRVDLAEVDQTTQRVPAKRTGFGINYGQGPRGLQTQLRMLNLDWTEEQCAEMIDGYLGVYEGVARFIRRTGAELAEHPESEVRDRWGMPRYLPGIHDQDARVRAEAERIAVSHKIQGGAQGMIQRSMAWLRPRVWELQQDGVDVRWCLEPHDELVFIMEEDAWPIMDYLVREALTEHSGCVLRVPVLANGSIGKSWAELK